MEVTYIGHSGFAVEFTHMILLFDYYTGKLPEWDRNKALMVFASHSHPDHFNWRILQLYEQYPKIHFFLGNDIRLGGKWMVIKKIPPEIKAKVTKLAGGRDIFYEEGKTAVRVRALKSTDAGVAFVVEAEGKRIYHAGDLNWWHWIGEPDQENEEMAKAYQKEIDRIAGQHFDLSFVPLDPRLEEAFDWGMNYFLEKTDSPVVFPMHLWGKYDTVSKYKKNPSGQKYAGRVMDIHRGGETWSI